MSCCDKYMERVSLYVDGELPEEEVPGLLAHLESCESCRSFCEALRAISADMEVSDAPEGFARSVMDAVGAAQVKNVGARRKPRLKAIAKWAGLAACLALIAAAGIKLSQGGAPAALGESEPACFGYTGAQAPAAGPEQPAGDDGIVDRDVEAPYPDNSLYEPDAFASGSCAGGIESVTVEHGETVSHTCDGELIGEIAGILSWSSAAETVPGGEADYIITVECADGENVISVWESDGELLCEGSEGAWVAQGSAEELREAVG